MAMSGNRNSESVVQVLVSEYAGRHDEVTLETTLFGDLNLWGDDAAELMETLSSRFDVDLSAFDFEKHFLPEGYSSLQLLFLPIVLATRLWRRYFSSNTPEEGEGLVPITVQQLVDAVRMKQWLGEWSRLPQSPAASWSTSVD